VLLLQITLILSLPAELCGTLADNSSASTPAACPAASAANDESSPAAGGLQDCLQDSTQYSAATATTAAAAKVAAAAEALGVSRESLLLWRCHAKTWQQQIDKDCHRTLPGHDWCVCSCIN
jgi:hypothetical protein